MNLLFCPHVLILLPGLSTNPPPPIPTEIGHCAFRNPAARPDCPPRRSVEARFTVIEPAPYEKPTALADPHPPEMLKQPWREFVHLPEKPPMWKPSFAREDMQVLEVA